MKTTNFILAVLLSFGLGCTTPNPKVPSETAPPPEPLKPTPTEPFTAKGGGELRIKFNPAYFPATYKTVEIIYAGYYHGYFNLEDVIYLPRITGRNELKAVFSDIHGNRVGESKTYYIEVD